MPGIIGLQCHALILMAMNLTGNYNKLFSDNVAPAAPSNVTASGMDLAIMVRWDAPTVDSNGDPLYDLGGYRIYVSDSAMTDPLTQGTLLKELNGTSYIHSLAPGTKKYYAVCAFDTSNPRNYSTFEMSGEGEAIGISDSSFDTTPPGKVTGLIEVGKGTDMSTTDDTDNVWIEFSWTAVADAYKYYIYR